MLLGAALSFITTSAVVNSNAIMVVVYDAKTRAVFQFQCSKRLSEGTLQGQVA